MKKIKLIFVCLSLVVSFAVTVNAAPVFFSFGGEKIIKVADFPNEKEFFMENGQFLDAGYVYKQVTIFFIPVWNYDGHWAGYVGSDEVYMPMTKEELDLIASEVNVILPETPNLSFWETVGGKLVIGLLLLLYIGWKFLSRQIEEQGEDSDGKSFKNTGDILSINKN